MAPKHDMCLLDGLLPVPPRQTEEALQQRQIRLLYG